MTRRSFSGFYVLLGDSLISWKCKKQIKVARSSTEAEYRTMATALCKVTWLYNILIEIRFFKPTPIPLYCDNTFVLHIAEDPVLHERTKNIELDCHFIRDQVKAGFLQPTYLPNAHQLVDLLTKPMSSHRGHYLQPNWAC